MKRTLLLFSAIFALNFAAHSQIDDTLSYFFKKQKYKAPVTGAPHPRFRSEAATVINDKFSHVGSIFINKSSVVVKGLEARVIRPALALSNAGNIPTRLYLAKVVNGLPVFPLLDSTAVLFTSVTDENLFPNGQLISGNLTSAKTVTGNFAVLIRCVSLQEGDGVLVFRTNGHHAASNTAPSNDYKFGDGLGVVRYQGVFSSTRDFPHPDFGYGTDYEFCVAPRVQYSLEISQAESPIQYGACCWQPFTNTNTSTYAWTSPQFNFSEFYNHLKPFNSQFPASFPGQERGLIWMMGDGSPTVAPIPNTDNVSLGFYGGDCNKFFEGTVTGNHKKMAPDTPESTTYTAQITFTSSTVWCNDGVGSGIREVGPLADVKVYPNPVIDKTTISGLKGKNLIQVYNMIGQVVLSQQTDKEEITIDFIKQPSGNYLLRVSDAENHSRSVKLIRQ